MTTQLRTPTHSEPMRFTVLLDEAMKLLRRRGPKAFLALAGPVIVLQVIMVVVQVGGMRTMFEGIEEQNPDLTRVWSTVGWSCLFAFVASLVFLVAFAAIGKYSQDVVAGRDADVSTSWRFGLKPGVFGTQLLASFFMGLSFIACLVGALYVVPALSLTVAVMVEEGLRGSAALTRSRDLARYNPGRRFLDYPMTRILGLLFVSLLVSYALAFVVQLPFSIAQQVIFFRSAVGSEGGQATLPTGALWLSVPSALFGAVAQMIAQFYLAFGLALTYFDIRRRRDALDLEQALDRLEGEAPPAGEPAS
ncbi:MAG: hypothetical protein R2991_09130 [Thermoanaerobaculia bacterium]